MYDLSYAAAATQPAPVSGTLNQQRILQTNTVIGFSKNGHKEKRITVITHPGGKIITAFPGVFTSPQTCFADENTTVSSATLQSNP